MSRAVGLAFSAIAYAVFFGTFLYLIAFVGDLPLAPRTVDEAPEAPVAGAAAINLILIALFGLQHSAMARPGFKRVWTRIVPVAMERSVYVLAESLMLILLFVAWRPIPETVWDLTGTAFEAPLWLLFSLMLCLMRRYGDPLLNRGGRGGRGSINHASRARVPP